MANGIVGLKPSYGAISRHGVMELAGTLDHVGPMTRSVEDAAIIFDAVAGEDAFDPTSFNLKTTPLCNELSKDIVGMQIGVDRNYIERGTDSGLVSAVDEVIGVFRELGAHITEVKIPRSDPVKMRELWLPITAYEAARAHKKTFPSRADEYGLSLIHI